GEAVRAQPSRRGVTTMAAVQVLGSGVSTVLAVVLAEKVQGGGAAGYSVLVSAMGVGALIGAAGASALGNRMPRESSFRVGFLLAALGVLLVGLSPSLA